MNVRQFLPDFSTLCAVAVAGVLAGLVRRSKPKQNPFDPKELEKGILEIFAERAPKVGDKPWNIFAEMELEEAGIGYDRLGPSAESRQFDVGKRLSDRIQYLRDSECPVCHRWLIEGNRSWLRGGSYPKYCSQECAKEGFEIKRRERRRAAKIIKSPLAKRVKFCPTCGTTDFSDRPARSIFCSKKCQLLMAEWRRRPATAAVLPPRQRIDDPVPFTPGECAICQKPLELVKQVYCSQPCKRKAEFARRAVQKKIQEGVLERLYYESPAICVECGGVIPFGLQLGNRLYCDRECYKKAKSRFDIISKQKRREAKKEAERKSVERKAKKKEWNRRYYMEMRSKREQPD